MKLKYLGVLFIMLGFIAPCIIQGFPSTTLYAAILPILCFWAGFLLILKPFDYEHKFNPYLKWARYAILINIVLTIVSVAYFYLIFYFDIRRGIGIHLMDFLGFVTNPIRSIFDRVVPIPSVQQDDGSILLTYSFIRGLSTDFVNLVLFSSTGVFLKIIKEKRKVTLPQEQ